MEKNKPIKMGHYEIKNETKEIIANMEKLNDADIKAIKNYMAFGYTMVPEVKEKKEVKIPTEAERLANPYSTINVQKYLAEEGTKDQQEKYWELFNEVIKDENGETVRYKKTTSDKKHKAGEPRVKGHVRTLKWFKEEFPNYEDSEWVKKNIKK